jgi:acetolactate synthase-1/2/3 large subunit
MTRRTGGEAIVAQLLQQGVDTVFGLPGAQIYGLFDALHQAGSDLRVVGARHEQACSYMAFGYARSTGRPGVYAVVPGPGMLNTGAALVTALGCNAPVLCLTGQVPSEYLGRGRGHLHELPDQLATMRGITKWADRIDVPAHAPTRVARAFQEMLSDRPGPVALEMPWDQFTATAEVAAIDPLPLQPAPAPDAEALASAARIIRDARAPMIFVGSGALHASSEVRELAERIEAPVVAFRSGRGIVGDDHEFGLTIAAAFNLWPETDCLIGIGTRLEVPYWRWPFRPAGLKTIRIDIDPAEMRRLAVDVGILADAAVGTASLTAELRRGRTESYGRREAIGAAKSRAASEVAEIQPHAAYLAAIRNVLPRDGLFVDEMCQAGFASWFAFPVYEPRTFISSGYQGTLGAGFPTALGVKVAHPDKPVVSVSGDGGFMFAVQELATAVQYGIGVVAVVFNNNAYGNVRRDQSQIYGRLLGADLVNPDFVRLADAFGVRSARVDTPQYLRRSLEAAFADGGCWLIEVPVDLDEEVSPWRFIHPKAAQ